MDDGTYWNIYSNDSLFQSGMTNGANYLITITTPTTTTTTTTVAPTTTTTTTAL
jgi:beta-xylosidase